MISPMVLLLVGAGLAAFVNVLVIGLSGGRRRSDQASPHWPSFLAYTVLILSSARVLAQGLGVESVNKAILYGGTPILAVVMLGALIAHLGRQTRPGCHWLLRAAMAVFVLQIISGFRNGQLPPQPRDAVEAFGLMFTPASFFVLAKTSLPTDDVLRLIRRTGAAVVLIALVAAVVVPQAAFLPGDRRISVPGVHGRLTGLTAHPNMLAAIAIITFVLFLSEKGASRVPMMLASLLTLLLTDARTAIGALFVGIAVHVLRTARVPAAVKFLTVIVAAGTAITQLQASSLTSLTSPQEEGALRGVATVSGRTDTWTAILHFWPDRLFVGWGPLAFSKTAQTPFAAGQLLSAHDAVLQSIAETGLFGLLAMSLLLLTVIRALFRRRRSKAMAPAAAGLVLLITESFLTSHPYGLTTLVLLVLMLAGLFVTNVEEQPDTGDVGADAPGSEPDALELARHRQPGPLSRVREFA